MDKYKDRGVSSGKEDVHKAISGLDKGLFPRAFCKILPDFAGNDLAFCNVMHADTAGTKPSLAYIYWRETGNPEVWKNLIQDALIMNLDDLICVGITDNIIVSSTIGRNRNLIPAEVISYLIQGTDSYLKELQRLGIGIHLAGGETADVGDIVRTLDVGFTAFARIQKNKIIDNANIRAGDTITGIASFGHASYEKTYNSGIGSNGLTSARHDVFSKWVAEKYPESYDHQIPEELVYSGNLKPLDKISFDYQSPDGVLHKIETDAASLVLSPTRTYAPVIQKILSQIPLNKIHGVVHCSGGGQTKVLHYIDNLHIIKDNLFSPPPVFKMIQEQSSTEWREMYRVFNMGHRMEIYSDEETSKEIIKIANAFGIHAAAIGRTESSSQKKVTVQAASGTFIYNG